MSVYACSDLHGNLNLYNQIKAYLTPGDKVYYLGDMADRHLQSWETLKAIMSDEQFIVLKGNHEDMLVNAMREYHDEPTFYGFGNEISLLYNNGGAYTLDGWINDGAHKGWIEHLSNLPLTAEYVNKNGQTLLMSHAGYTPTTKQNNFQWGEDLLWDRRHFFDAWPKDEVFKDTIIVHGHTPIQYIQDELNIEADSHFYCEGHKICLDCWTYRTKTAVLLDLDNLTFVPFSENSEVSTNG